MAALLNDEVLDITDELSRIRRVGYERTQKYIDEGLFKETQGNQLLADLELCLTLDQFDFAMPGQYQDELLVMKPSKDAL